MVFYDARSNAHQFLIAALLGSVGAMISVLQRFHSMPVELYTSRAFIAINGCARILLGATFGAVFLLFHKGDMLLEVAEGQAFFLYAAALFTALVSAQFLMFWRSSKVKSSHETLPSRVMAHAVKNDEFL
jgi:hypothetical protein